MSLLDLSVLYVLVGLACSLAVAHRSKGEPRPVASLVLTFLIWPLWAPLALARETGPAADAQSPRALSTRIAAAMDEGMLAAAGSPLAQLLPEEAVNRIVQQARRTEARLHELDRLLCRADLSRETAASSVTRLEDACAPERVLLPARLALANIDRLRALRDADRQTLEELSVLAATLRTQLMLARYAGSPSDGIGNLIAELGSRVEGLDEAIDYLSAPLASSVPGRLRADEAHADDPP